MLGKPKKGVCETCGKPNRSLRELDSGQWVCRSCLKEIRPARSEANGSLATIHRLQSLGYHIDDYATKDETQRLKMIDQLRKEGVRLSESATEEEITDGLGSVVHEWFDKIAGVSRTQKLVRCLRPGERLFPERDPKNRYDSNAIRLLNAQGEQVGWIRAETNGSMAQDLDRGVYHEVFVSEITGHNQRTLGVNIRIVKYPHRRIQAGVAARSIRPTAGGVSSRGTAQNCGATGVGHFVGRVLRYLVQCANKLFGSGKNGDA